MVKTLLPATKIEIKGKSYNKFNKAILQPMITFAALIH